MDTRAAQHGWKLALGAAIIGALLRFSGLEAKSLWGDEIITLTVSMGHSWYPWLGEETQPFYSASHYRDLVALDRSYYSDRLGALLRMNDQVPPLYYVLLNLWVHSFGTSAAALRSLSLLASVATIPVLYLLGRTLSSPRVGAYSAWVFALAPFQVAFALYSRPYAWLGLFAILSTLAAVRLSRGASVTWLAIYAVVVTLGVYTHYLFVWNVVFQVILVAFYRRDNRRFLVEFGVACSCAVVAFLFWAPTFLAQVQWSREFGHQSWFYWYSGVPAASTVVLSAGRNVLLLLSTGRITDTCGEGGGTACQLDAALTAVFYAVPLMLLALSGWRLLEHIRRRARATDLIPDPWGTCLLWAGSVFVGPLMMDLVLDSHTVASHRYFIAASGPIYLTVAMGVLGLHRRVLRRSIGAGFLLFLLAGSGLYLRGSVQALVHVKGAREVARHIDGRSVDSDDLVLVLDPGLNPVDFAYYLRSNPDFARIEIPERHRSVPDIPAQLQAVISTKPRARIWYLDDQGPEDRARRAVLEWLRTNYLELEAQNISNVAVFLFTARESLP